MVLTLPEFIPLPAVIYGLGDPSNPDIWELADCRLVCLAPAEVSGSCFTSSSAPASSHSIGRQQDSKSSIKFLFARLEMYVLNARALLA